MAEEKAPVIETPGDITPVPGEKDKEKTPDPGAKGEGDDKKEEAGFLEVEGMGKVTPDDVKGLKAAQTGLEKERNDLRDQVSALEKQKKETEDKDLSDEDKRKKEYEEERAALAEDRKVLIDEKLALAFTKAGITVPHTAFNVEVSKLSEVSAAVAEFAEKYPGLVKKEDPGKPEKPAPAGGSPGETPPALDKEKEWLARMEAAEKTGDLAELKKIKAEIDAYRGRDALDKGAASL